MWAVMLIWGQYPEFTHTHLIGELIPLPSGPDTASIIQHLHPCRCHANPFVEIKWSMLTYSLMEQSLTHTSLRQCWCIAWYIITTVHHHFVNTNQKAGVKSIQFQLSYKEISYTGEKYSRTTLRHARAHTHTHSCLMTDLKPCLALFVTWVWEPCSSLTACLTNTKLHTHTQTHDTDSHVHAN